MASKLEDEGRQGDSCRPCARETGSAVDDDDLSSNEQSKSKSVQQWMSQVPVQLQSVPLYKLAIPGTHNSGSFSCEVISGISSDAPAFVKNLVKLPGFGSSALLSIVQNWSICQSWDIAQQLEGGIRYFDLRISTKKGSDELFVVHSLYGERVENILKDINCFLEEHPREVVLLDFNHFYDMETEHHIILITLLIAELGSKICCRGHMDDLTLKQLWDAGKQVVIFYHNIEGSEFDEVWPGSCITSPWPDTDVSAKCIAKLSSFHTEEHKSGFYVSQGVLTPTLASIMKNVLSANLLSLNKGLVAPLLAWIKESPKTCAHQPNIIIADFVHYSDFVQHVLELNKLRTS